MSLIISNRKTLGNTAIIVLGNKKGNEIIEHNGDFTVIKSGDEVIGINVFNHDKYFKTYEGAHTLNDDQAKVLKDNGIQINNYESHFSVGEVIERNAHPKSDKLFVLKVRTNKDLQIVTNSLNSLVGTKVVVANVGATLPSGLPIVFSKVMGVESEGMLCGGETLGKDKTEGVMLVDLPVGSKFIL